MIESDKNQSPVPDGPRGPSSTPGLPNPRQDDAPKPPVQDPGDTKNPNDPPLNPALLPIGDPASMA
ncbi:hypothetical protein G6L28_14975 [Agrobacterium larrymoorei]|uniref:hypothetical protein n=1 Tax=Agrobacterium larrymoorei TaxID=160699 RepID=UPI001571ED4C|nr:hypothetical protein [Agrobacterium larrymoorei]NTJ43902.1 hypothetical protein [Agrobacterium larrymoorei]